LVSELEAALDPILCDRESGSRTIAGGVAQVLAEGPLPALVSVSAYTGLCRHILQRVPAFALVFDLLHSVGAELYPDTAAAPVAAERFRAAAVAWRRRWWTAAAGLARQAAPVIPDGARLAVHSNSGAVLDLLRALRDRKNRVSVACSESRPGGEGTLFATRARDLGIPAKVYADPDLVKQLSGCAALLLGADAVLAESYWNKIGSLELARAARAAGIPHYVLAECAKWVSPLWAFPAFPPAPFEAIPARLVTALVSEEGCLDVSRFGPRKRTKPLFAALGPQS
jgi:translation initiation factor eIF-2B subunit delta